MNIDTPGGGCPEHPFHVVTIGVCANGQNGSRCKRSLRIEYLRRIGLLEVSEASTGGAGTPGAVEGKQIVIRKRVFHIAMSAAKGGWIHPFSEFRFGQDPPFSQSQGAFHRLGQAGPVFIGDPDLVNEDLDVHVGAVGIQSPGFTVFNRIIVSPVNQKGDITVIVKGDPDFFSRVG